VHVIHKGQREMLQSVGALPGSAANLLTMFHTTDLQARLRPGPSKQLHPGCIEAPLREAAQFTNKQCDRNGKHYEGNETLQRSVTAIWSKVKASFDPVHRSSL
jgi:hypothetical protein